MSGQTLARRTTGTGSIWIFAVGASSLLTVLTVLGGIPQLYAVTTAFDDSWTAWATARVLRLPRRPRAPCPNLFVPIAGPAVRRRDRAVRSISRHPYVGSWRMEWFCS
jgi:hypothetical protein